MPNGEIVFDMEQYKHELEQIEVSNADKTKPERGTAPETIITDSSRFVGAQQSDPRCEGD